MKGFKNAGVREQGFTLVELSIVIIIIGLIVAGVLGGQRLIDAARLRTIVGDKTDVETAVNNFRNEFSALPGDFRGAWSYWSAKGCGYGATPDQESCDGDGNKQIHHAINDKKSESYTAWEHLALSGHYPGAFTGDSTLGGVETATVPGARFGKGVVITMLWDADMNSSAFPAGATYDGNIILFGAPTATLSTTPAMSDVPFLEPRDAAGLDEKIDDNKPNTGKVFGVNDHTADATSCIVDSNATPTADTKDDVYNVSSTSTKINEDGCGIAFALGN